METNKISNNDFKPKDVGRGIWHFWHTVGFSAECKDDIISLYKTILIYSPKIRCNFCNSHSNLFIDSTSEYINSIFNNEDLTDSEIIDLFNRWLYKYHCQANIHSGKDPLLFPSYEEIAEFYLNFEICNEDCNK